MPKLRFIAFKLTRVLKGLEQRSINDCLFISILMQKGRGMNFLKIKTSWSNAELIVLKLCIASGYILVGAYFHSLFRHYDVLLLGVFGITCVWSVYLWVIKMRRG